MTEAKKATPNSKAAAEREVTKEPQTIEFRGLELNLPVELPLSVSFDLAGGVGGPFADLRFLGSVLGNEQTALLRAKLDAEKLALDPEGTKVLGHLIEEILSAYGFETGESLASAKS